jgi:hypothetical protein
MWSPKDFLAIQLWKFNNQGHSKLPSGVPKLIPFCQIRNNDVSKSIEKEIFINSDISQYLVSFLPRFLSNQVFLAIIYSKGKTIWSPKSNA